METIIIKELKQTCDGCPSQWEGKTDDGKYVYIRYRYGWLSFCIGSVYGEVLGLSVGNSMDGCMTEEELATYLGHLVQFPKHIG